MLRTLLISFIILSFVFPVCGQPLLPTGKQNSESAMQEVPVPSQWNITKYGNHNHDLYTGTASATIPLYTYTDCDFTLPISITYKSNGYIPGIQAGPLGLGWALIAEGQITRKVQNIPDEGSKTLNMNFVYGYHTFYEADPTIKHDYIFDRPSRYNANFYYNVNDKLVETSPDIFSFNFLGHRGQFMLGLNSIHVFNTQTPQGEYKIWMSPDFKHITITTGDGYEYYFQALQQNMAYYTSTSHATPVLVDEKRINPLVWKLFQITAPNKRIVKFEYANMERVETLFPCGQTIFEHYQEDNDWTGPSQYTTFNSSMEYSATLKTDNLLRSIQIDNTCKINFTYIQRSNDERAILKDYSGSSSSQWFNHPLKNTRVLYKIDITKPAPSTQTIKSINFLYRTFGAQHILEAGGSSQTNNVLYLGAVVIPGEGTYQLNYYNEDTLFPFHGTIQIDHWGYYKGFNQFEDPNIYGSDSLARFMPATSLNPDYSEHLPVDITRYPNWEKARYGMLRSIIYPTGGNTRFYYEPHDYSAKVTKDYHSQNKPELRSCKRNLAGGVRIQRQVNYTSATDSTIIFYTYKRKNGESSGILVHFPRYRIIIQSYTANNSPGYLHHWVERWTTNDMFTYRAIGTHIEYEDVQVNYQDNSHTDYQFTTYKQVPDQMYNPALVVINQFAINAGYQILFPAFFDNFHMTPYNMASQRGKIRSIVKYNNNNEVQAATRNNYDYSKQLKAVESVENPANHFYIAKTYVEGYPLISAQNIKYYHNGKDSTCIEHTYYYNRHGQQYKAISTDGQGRIITDSIQYVTDIPDGQRSDIEQALIDRNKLSTYFYKITKTQHPNSSVSFKSLKYTYGVFMDNICLKNQLSATFDTPQQLAAGQGYRSEEEICEYDSGARPLQVKNAHGLSTCYIWGYGGMHIIAKIENASLSDILAISGLEEIKSTPLNGVLTEAQNESLRSIPKTFVTTYDYKILIGICSITDPNGMTHFYEYDKQGRLTTIRDNDNRLMTEYSYSAK